MKFTSLQKDVYRYAGLPAELFAVEWLRSHQWVVDSPPRARHRGYYDIKAVKKGETWLVEVKSGKEPSINIGNVLKMVRDRTAERVAVLFVCEGEPQITPLLFQLSKREYAAWKASDTKGRARERAAGRKVALSRAS